MGEVIRFPEDHGLTRAGKYIDANTEPATVIILPVIRIDRGPESSGPDTNSSEPQTGNGKRKRRRAAR